MVDSDSDSAVDLAAQLLHQYSTQSNGVHPEGPAQAQPAQPLDSQQHTGDHTNETRDNRTVPNTDNLTEESYGQPPDHHDVLIVRNDSSVEAIVNGFDPFPAPPLPNQPQLLARQPIDDAFLEEYDPPDLPPSYTSDRRPPQYVPLDGLYPSVESRRRTHLVNGRSLLDSSCPVCRYLLGDDVDEDGELRGAAEAPIGWRVWYYTPDSRLCETHLRMRLVREERIRREREGGEDRCCVM